jgi:hypothetical protein
MIFSYINSMKVRSFGKVAVVASCIYMLFASANAQMVIPMEARLAKVNTSIEKFRVSTDIADLRDGLTVLLHIGREDLSQEDYSEQRLEIFRQWASMISVLNKVKDAGIDPWDPANFPHGSKRPNTSGMTESDQKKALAEYKRQTTADVDKAKLRNKYIEIRNKLTLAVAGAKTFLVNTDTSQRDMKEFQSLLTEYSIPKIQQSKILGDVNTEPGSNR